MWSEVWRSQTSERLTCNALERGFQPHLFYKYNMNMDRFQLCKSIKDKYLLFLFLGAILGLKEKEEKYSASSSLYFPSEKQGGLPCESM